MSFELIHSSSLVVLLGQVAPRDGARGSTNRDGCEDGCHKHHGCQSISLVWRVLSCARYPVILIGNALHQLIEQSRGCHGAKLRHRTHHTAPYIETKHLRVWMHRQAGRHYRQVTERHQFSGQWSSRHEMLRKASRIQACGARNIT
jgi:hypothetical protein